MKEKISNISIRQSNVEKYALPGVSITNVTNICNKIYYQWIGEMYFFRMNFILRYITVTYLSMNIYDLNKPVVVDCYHFICLNAQYNCYLRNPVGKEMSGWIYRCSAILRENWNIPMDIFREYFFPSRFLLFSCN